MSIVTGGFGAAGAVLSVVLVAVMMSAISDAGGSVNLFRALAPSSVTAGEPDVHEVYATVDSQPLSVAVYRPRGAVRPAPTLFYIHGGGWTSGSETDLPTQMRWFADRGWVVVSAQYRLATTTDHTWDRASTDVACALSWTVRNAAQFGADPSRLVVMGQSAGGNLALNLAYGAAAGRASSACGGVVPVPRAVAVDYPAVDPARLYDNDFTIGSFAIHDAAAEYVGGSPQQYPDRYRATSSASFITAKAPPTLIIQGEQDSLVPPDSVYGFADQARAAQVDITLAKIPFVNHSYDGLTAGSLGTQAFLTTSQNYLEKRVQP
jgi:acetyl esterase/lipase